MSPDLINSISWLFDFVVLIKLFAMALTFFYFLFVLIVARQVSLMNQVLYTSFTPVINFITFTQVIAVGFLFFIIFALV